MNSTGVAVLSGLGLGLLGLVALGGREVAKRAEGPVAIDHRVSFGASAAELQAMHEYRARLRAEREAAQAARIAKRRTSRSVTGRADQVVTGDVEPPLPLAYLLRRAAP